MVGIASALNATSFGMSAITYHCRSPFTPFMCRIASCTRKVVVLWDYCAKPLGEGVEKGWRGKVEPYPELGEGGATRSEIALVKRHPPGQRPG